VTANGVLTGSQLQSLQTSPASFQTTGTIPITPFSGQSPNAFAPNLRTPYVQSWSVGIQRELTPSTVIEVRYVGNHSVALWRQDNLNEINIFENGFLQEFKNAASNLAICNANLNTTCLAAEQGAGILPVTATKGVADYANLGLPGQQNLPIFTAAFTGSTSGSQTASSNWRSGTFITPLLNGGAGQIGNVLGTTSTFMCAMFGSNAFGLNPVSGLTNCPQPTAGNGITPAGAGFPVNFFIANPQASSGGAFRFYNGSQSTYNSLVVEMRRRPAHGLEFSGSYVFSRALTNYYGDSSSSFTQFTTLRNTGYSKGISPWNLTHQFKFSGIYEFPFGPGRKWNSDNRFMQRLIGGWQLAGINRWQTGRPFLLQSGGTANLTFNSNDSGVTLIGITPQQLQSQLAIRKTTNSQGLGQVFYFPASLIVGGQANSAVLAPCNTPGQLCNRVFLTGPGFFRADISMIKHTKITERVEIELRAEALNAFNNINFYYPGSATSTAQAGSATSTSFGQVTAAFQDPNTTDDNGGRILQLVFRINF